MTDPHSADVRAVVTKPGDHEVFLDIVEPVLDVNRAGGRRRAFSPGTEKKPNTVRVGEIDDDTAALWKKSQWARGVRGGRLSMRVDRSGPSGAVFRAGDSVFVGEISIQTALLWLRQGIAVISKKTAEIVTARREARTREEAGRAAATVAQKAAEAQQEAEAALRRAKAAEKEAAEAKDRADEMAKDAQGGSSKA